LSPANEPTRYQNSRMRKFNPEFGYETRDQSFEESRTCNELGRGDQVGSDISHDRSYNKHAKKANVRFRKKVKQKPVQEINPPTGSRCGAKKSTKPPKPITVREIFESLRVFNRELQRDLSDEEDPQEICTDDFDFDDDDIFFRRTYVISGGPPPETAPETALPTTPSRWGINHEQQPGSPEQREN